MDAYQYDESIVSKMLSLEIDAINESIETCIKVESSNDNNNKSIHKQDRAIYNYNYKNMDDLSILIQNKQFISILNDIQLNDIKDDIINTLFGGFRGLLQWITKPWIANGCLTTIEHIKLNKILSKTLNQHT